ncbi:hypothetical protein [Planosporangium mesophilum]|uniref:Peptidase M23 n=1 Tax=Planosporangium mesophilum TaxID=689768 RepID=A0A8J3TDI7_9ACTN|nr:hypothetical protein [Planosporangium mesophilum]NJC85100.1 hypothetical protein [Planosporangium mesophilum]GII24448.1 hypothetical protein Pme01_40450 [Planosporangium mesophilum]
MGAVAASIALAGVGIASWGSASTTVQPAAAGTERTTLTGNAERAAEASAASRGRARSESTSSAGSTSPARPQQKPRPTSPAQEAPAAVAQQNAPQQPAVPAPPAAKPSPTKPAPVAGLDRIQMDNAIAIVRAGQEMKLSRRAFVVAISTALQESQLRNLANTGIPASLNLTNEGTGQDHDSVGLFQQRVTMGWGSLTELMDPKSSARAFYNRLVTIVGWEQMPVTVAAQSVQGSAFPYAYAQHESRAQQIVDAIIQ